MPNVRAILVADVHLQTRAPVARAAEPDWFAAMARPLAELQELQALHKGAPIIYAGDIFDRWNAGPELINFALQHLPFGYAVPGQHDLPNHNYDEIGRSAYWTLVEAGRIENLLPNDIHNIASWGMVLTGYPWGYPVHPEKLVEERRTSNLPDGPTSVAVVHRMIWQKGTGYPGAPVDRMVGGYRAGLAGYDVAVFGDNHKGFITKIKGGPVVCNCGGFMRRHADEGAYRPGVGLLYADGTVARHYLDITKDHFAAATEAEETVAQILDITAFMEELQALGVNDALDFTATLKRFIADNKTPRRVADIILRACEGG